MQGNRSISIKEKISIVCEVLSGKPKRAVAREYKVSRPSVHTWTRKGLDALRVALQPEKRGPKFKRESSPLQGEAKKEVQKLKRVIKKKEKQIKNLQKKIALQKKDTFRPQKCPNCGFKKIYKNGTYRIKTTTLLKKLKNQEEVTVQQFFCIYCERPVHPPEEKRIVVFL